MKYQYRLIVDDKEYFIDLLFYNRRLRCLVAIELKWTEFLPEYVGKMSFLLIYYFKILNDKYSIIEQ